MTAQQRAAAYERARKATMARIAEGTRFMTKDIREIAEACGMGHGGYAFANQITQGEQRAGRIRCVERDGSAFIWQSTTTAPKPPPPLGDPTPPKVIAPTVVGPYDPPTAIEGSNTGLTEAVADRLWRTIGGGDLSREMREVAKPMEAHGWRWVATDLIEYLGRLGFHGPNGAARPEGWDWAWNFDCANGEVVDGKGGVVALVMNEEDVPLICAAPRMAEAIFGVVDRFEERGGIKRADVEALQVAVGNLPRAAKEAV